MRALCPTNLLGRKTMKNSKVTKMIARLGVTAFVTAVLLTGALATLPRSARADSGWHIRNDATGGDCTLIGTWNHATKTCVLTTDVTASITIDDNAITLDGGGHMVASSEFVGIYASSRSGLTIRNIVIRGSSFYGILLEMSNGNTIAENTLYGSGIYLFFSNGNTITGNTGATTGSRYGVLLGGSKDNMVKGNTLSGGTAGVFMWSARDNTVMNNRVTDVCTYGIHLQDSRDIAISGNTISFGLRRPYCPGLSISLYASSGIRLSGNVMIDGGVFLSGDRRGYWDTHRIDPTNTVDGKPVHYLTGSACGTIPSGAGQLIIASCPGALVEGRTMTGAIAEIQLGFSPHSTVRSNTLLASNYGLLVDYSGGSTISGNTISGWYGGIAYGDASGGTIIGNTVTRGGINVWGSSGITISGNSVSGGIGMSGATGFAVSGNTVSGGTGYGFISRGIGLGGYKESATTDTLVSGNMVSGYIDLDFASHNTLDANTISGGGISLNGASEMNAVNGNTASGGTYGISLTYWYPSNNVISGNTFSGSKYGVYLENAASGNVFRENTVSGNTYGIYLESSDGNTFYHNNIVANTHQAYSHLSTNDWEQSNPSCRAGVYSCQGNYWSDYIGLDDGTGVGRWGEARPAGDGVGDTLTPHLGMDWYPLMNPWP